MTRLEIVEDLPDRGKILRRREQLHQRDHSLPSPTDPRTGSWGTLARAIRERADIVDVFTSAGWIVSFAGRSNRRNCDEYAGRCLRCGGRDRMRVWTNGASGGRFWCRQCRFRGDVIDAYAELHYTDFYSAVRALAKTLGLSTEVLDCRGQRAERQPMTVKVKR
jgi:hypothetical protein